MTAPTKSLSKRQKEKIKKIRKGQRPGGAHPNPTTSYSKLATRGSEGGNEGPEARALALAGSRGSFCLRLGSTGSGPSRASQAGEGAAPSVLIDSKNPDPVELGQFGDEHTHQGHGVEDEMDLVILGIEAGEEVPGWKGWEEA